MKFFAVILLAGYFLARGREAESGTPIRLLLRDWLYYLGMTVTLAFLGWAAPLSTHYMPVAFLLFAVLLGVLLQSPPPTVFAAAMTAFALLWLPGNGCRLAAALIVAGFGTLTLSFFYTGARERMLRLPVSAAARGEAGRLIVLLVLAALWAVLYQKIVQIF